MTISILGLSSTYTLVFLCMLFGMVLLLINLCVSLWLQKRTIRIILSELTRRGDVIAVTIPEAMVNPVMAEPKKVAKAVVGKVVTKTAVKAGKTPAKPVVPPALQTIRCGACGKLLDDTQHYCPSAN